jgi:hypothetical protein
MMFVQSLHGISHNKIEDTREEHLELCVPRSIGWRRRPWRGWRRRREGRTQVDHVPPGSPRRHAGLCARLRSLLAGPGPAPWQHAASGTTS